MERETIGIDLGASYTKVSYRPSLERRPRNQFADADTEIMRLGGTVTLPSLVIMTRDPARQWISGTEAAAITPDSSLEVFENWKSALYSSDFDANKVKLVSVANAFFLSLAQEVSRCGLQLDEHVRVRVTIPGLKRIEDRQDALKECMRLNGWPKEIEVVMEPLANLIGVLSQGRNCVTGKGRMNYWLSIGPTDDGGDQFPYVFNEMRRVALRNRTDREMTIMAVDLGSFTLDVAKMTLDLKVTDYDQFPVDDIFEESWEIGVIKGLDNRCLEKVFRNHGVDVSSRSFFEKESAKTALYAGSEYAIPGTRTVIGKTDSDRQAVNETLHQFCEESWQAIATICTNVEVAVLTGGAACIPEVNAYLTEKMKKSGVLQVIELPRNGNAPKVDSGHHEIVRWRDSGEGLVRLATALGAASIGFGFEPDEFCRSGMGIGRGASL